MNVKSGSPPGGSRNWAGTSVPAVSMVTSQPGPGRPAGRGPDRPVPRPGRAAGPPPPGPGHAGHHALGCARQRHEAPVADQFGHPAGRGRRHHLGRGPGLQDLPVVQDRHLVRERLRGLELVGHQHGRHLPGRDQLADQVGEVAPEAGVQPGVGLVQQQRVTPAGQQPAERDPVGLAAGQPGRAVVQQPADAEPLRDPGDLVPAGPGPGRSGPRRPGSAGPTGAGTAPDPGAAGRPGAATAGPGGAARRSGSAPGRPAPRRRGPAPAARR